MMTEKEYETLKEKRDNAKRFMDYCLDTAASVQEGINGATDFGYYGLTVADMEAEEADLDMMTHIYGELVKFKTQLEQRGEYWEKIYGVLKDEVADVEDELRREEEALEYGDPEYNNPAYDEPDYGISYGERLWSPEPDYVSYGIGA